MTLKESYEKIVDNIKKVMKGQSRAIRMLLAGFISGGHVLLVDEIVLLSLIYNPVQVSGRGGRAGRI